MMKQKHQNQKGFTIVELMIALSVLSIMLVIAATLIINIGRLFNKGVSAASLNNVNRNIVSEIAASLELQANSPGAPIPDSSGGVNSTTMCIGSNRYSFTLNRKQGTDQSTGVRTDHVLWRDDLPTGGCSATELDNPNSDGTGVDGHDLVPDNMRITKFSITELPPTDSGVYRIEVNMAYGDDDLLSPLGDERPNCKGDRGTEFCATSRISQTVVRRLSQ